MKRLTTKNKQFNDYSVAENLRHLDVRDYLYSINQKMGKYEDLEEQIGCPLEVRCKIYQGVEVFVESVYWDSLDEEDKTSLTKQTVSSINSNGFSTFSGKQCYWKNHKKTWWLKEDKSE